MRIQLYDKMESSPSGDLNDNFSPYLESFLLSNVSAARGAVLVCPGGGYHARAPHEGDPIAEKFNTLGFHAFVLQYRVAPYRYPAGLRDAQRAIRLIRKNAGPWKIDPGKIAILGFSAGGHLAASAGVLWREIPAETEEEKAISPRPDAMILCYPVIAAAEPFAHEGSMINLLGKNPPPELLKKMDLHKAVTTDTPPAFLWHTADDDCVPVRNSLAFAEAMWKKSRRCELHVFPHGHHGRGLGTGLPDIAQWPALAAQFLKNL